MAFTATVIKETVHGNQRVTHFTVVADAASGVVDSQMGYVEAINFAPVSMATAGGKFKANLNDSSATANGKVFVSSVASGDVFFLTVYGR